MPVLAANNLTLLDHAKRRDPSGKTAKIAEVLSQTNEMFEDAVFKHGNRPNGNEVVVRTGYPDVYWRAYNQGIPSSKSRTAVTMEPVALLEARSEVDARLARLEDDEAAFRASEATAFIEAMGQEGQKQLLYGDTLLNSKVPMGLTPRYSAQGGVGTAANVINAGDPGTPTGNTSMWLIGWGEETIFCHYPKGSMAGIEHKDLGEYTKQADGLNHQVLGDLFNLNFGLSVRDWRYAVRIANINVAALLALSGAQALTDFRMLLKCMSRALSRIPNRRMCRTLKFYCHPQIWSLMNIMAMEKQVNTLAIKESLNEFGQMDSWTTFQGVPIGRVDQLALDELYVP